MGMLLIMAGHAPGLPPSLGAWLFSFHVPLFFLLSGYGIKSQVPALGLFAHLVKLARALLVPFLFFWLVSYLYWLPSHKMGGNVALYQGYTLVTPWLGLAKATGEALPMNPALWFFTALFMVSVLFWLLQKALKNNRHLALVAAGISLIAVGYFNDASRSWDWNADIALCCLVFFALGAALHDQLDQFNEKEISLPGLSAAAAVFLALSVCGAALDGPVDINQRHFGYTGSLFMLTAICGMALTICLAKIIRKNRVLQFLSENSLTLFALHMVAYRVLTAIFIIIFHLDREQLGSTFMSVVYTAWAIAVLYPVIYGLRRWAPWILGGRK